MQTQRSLADTPRRSRTGRGACWDICLLAICHSHGDPMMTGRPGVKVWPCSYYSPARMCRKHFKSPDFCLWDTESQVHVSFTGTKASTLHLRSSRRRLSPRKVGPRAPLLAQEAAAGDRSVPSVTPDKFFRAPLRLASPEHCSMPQLCPPHPDMENSDR